MKQNLSPAMQAAVKVAESMAPAPAEQDRELLILNQLRLLTLKAFKRAECAENIAREAKQDVRAILVETEARIELRKEELGIVEPCPYAGEEVMCGECKEWTSRCEPCCGSPPDDCTCGGDR